MLLNEGLLEALGKALLNTGFLMLLSSWSRVTFQRFFSQFWTGTDPNPVHDLMGQGPKDHLNMRISHSGSEAQYKGDTINNGS